MIFKKKVTQHTLNVFVAVICLVVIILGYGATASVSILRVDLKNTIEQTWREQARRTLTDLGDQFVAGVDDKTIDLKNDSTINHWSSINIAGVRNGGNTSDAFLIKMPEELFEWDGSTDCAKPEFLIYGRYLKDEPALHKNPDLAWKVVTELRKMYNTKAGDNQYWLFDDSPELLEWRVIPKETKGFEGQPLTIGGAVNPKYVAFVLVLGTQQDEIMKPYESTFNTLTKIENGIKITSGFASLITILNMLIFVYLTKQR